MSIPSNPRLVKVPEHVVFREFATETVVLNLTTGLYHGLNGSAGRMFELLNETGVVEEVAKTIAGEYDQPVAAVRVDLDALIDDLADRGLLEIN